MEGFFTVLSNKDFLLFLNDTSIDTSSEESLRKIIEEESEKPIEVMNTELIEHCLDAIDALQSEIQPKTGKVQGDTDVKHKRISYKKILILAATLVMLLVSIVYVWADKEENLFDGIVQVFNDHVRIHFSDTDTEETVLLHGSELQAELAKNGFDGVVLPEMFYSAESEVTHIDYDYTDFINSSVIFVNCDNIRADIHITRFAKEELVFDLDINNATSEIIKAETQSADIFCCEQGDIASLDYRCGLDLYTILLHDTTLEKAVELAKTIQ